MYVKHLDFSIYWCKASYKGYLTNGHGFIDISWLYRCYTATSFMIFTIAEVIYEAFGTNEISYYQCVEAIGSVSSILAGIFGVGIYGLFKNGIVKNEKNEER